MADKGTKKPDERLLLLAARLGHEFIVSAFLGRADVDLNLTTGYGQTALSLAAENGHADIVEILSARHDVDVNTQDLDGQTPLGWAVFNGQATVVADLLLNPEIRLDIADIEGRTPLSWAIINHHDLILGLLLHRLGLCCDSRTRQAPFRSADESMQGFNDSQEDRPEHWQIRRASYARSQMRYFSKGGVFSLLPGQTGKALEASRYQISADIPACELAKTFIC